MPKAVLLSTPARKQFESLDGSVKDRIRKALGKLSEAGAGDIKRLRGVRGRETLLRLRVGDYRVVYRDDPDAIRITQIFHRGKGYDWLE
jgi:mRNA-degrading endonuclease RelE of RelBE toxin-antitoxin system